MSGDIKEIEVKNIDDNSTGWVSRLVGAFIIAGAIGTGADSISDAIDRQTNAIDRQTNVLSRVSP